MLVIQTDYSTPAAALGRRANSHREALTLAAIFLSMRLGRATALTETIRWTPINIWVHSQQREECARRSENAVNNPYCIQPRVQLHARCRWYSYTTGACCFVSVSLSVWSRGPRRSRTSLHPPSLDLAKA